MLFTGGYLLLELSAILSCNNKLPSVRKAKNMSCLIWSLNTGFIVRVCVLVTCQRILPDWPAGTGPGSGTGSAMVSTRGSRWRAATRKQINEPRHDNICLRGFRPGPS